MNDNNEYIQIDAYKRERSTAFNLLVLISCVVFTVLLGLSYMNLRNVYYEDPAMLMKMAEYSALALSVAVFTVFLTGEDIEKGFITGIATSLMCFFLLKWFFFAILPTGAIYDQTVMIIGSYIEKIHVLGTLYRIVSPYIITFVIFVPLLLMGTLLQTCAGILNDHVLTEHVSYLYNTIWIICCLCFTACYFLKAEKTALSVFTGMYHTIFLFITLGFLSILKEYFFRR